MANFLTQFFKREPAVKNLQITGRPGERDSYSRPAKPATSTRALQRAHAQNELAFACIGIKATAAIDPRLVVQQRRTVKGKTTYEEIPDHPFRELFSTPNDWMSEGDLMAAAFASWDTTNPRKFFCLKRFNGYRLATIDPLDPTAMQPLHSRTSREVIGYIFDNGVHREEFSLDELIIRSAPAWYNPSPGVAAAGAVELDTNQTNYVRTFFLNGGMPSHYLKYTKMALNDAQREAIRAKWQSTYGNAGAGQHSVGVLDMNMDIQRLGAMLDELNSDSLTESAEARICMAYGVPPLIIYARIGLMRATYNNLGEAWEWFWKSTMSPQFKGWRTFWTRTLLSEFENERDIRREDVRLHYDMSLVDALQDNLDATHERARKAYRAGGLRLNEYRELIGRDPVDGPEGEEFYKGPMRQQEEDRDGL